MKKRVLVYIGAAFLLFLNSSPWEGAAAVAPPGELPESGFFVATNSFPRNTVVDITNIENGRTVRAIVANTLSSTGLLAVVSHEAAEMIGMRVGSISRVRMVQPSDPMAYLRFTERLAAGIPVYDPETEERLHNELYGSDTYIPPQTVQPNVETSSGMMSSVHPNITDRVQVNTPGYVVDEPEWGGNGRLSIIDTPRFAVDPIEPFVEEPVIVVNINEPEPVSENTDHLSQADEPQTTTEIEVASIPLESQTESPEDLIPAASEQHEVVAEKPPVPVFIPIEIIAEKPPVVEVEKQILPEEEELIEEEPVYIVEEEVIEEEPVYIVEEEVIEEELVYIVEEEVIEEEPVYIVEEEVIEEETVYLADISYDDIIKDISDRVEEIQLEEIIKDVPVFISTEGTIDEIIKDVLEYIAELQRDDIIKDIFDFFVKPQRDDLEKVRPDWLFTELYEIVQEETQETIYEVVQITPVEIAEEQVTAFEEQTSIPEEQVSIAEAEETIQEEERLIQTLVPVETALRTPETTVYEIPFESIIPSVSAVIPGTVTSDNNQPDNNQPDNNQSVNNQLANNTSVPLAVIDTQPVIIPPPVTVSPVVTAPQVTVPSLSVQTISQLDRGQYYVQLAALPVEMVENTVRQIDQRYNPVVFIDRDNLCRVLIGPLNQGESAAILQRFRSIGYSDAFVRQGS